MRRTVTVSILVIAICMACPSAYAQSKAKILIVNSYHADSPWVKAHNSLLVSELSDKVLLSFAYLDSKRLSRKETEATVNHAWQMFNKIKPDLVILADDYALERLGRRILTTLTPVVFLGINNNPRQYVGNMSQITGVLERPLLKRSISYIQEIIGGDMTKCLVLFDNSMTAQTTFRHNFKGNYSQFFNWTEVKIQMASTWYLWRETVLNAKRNGYDAIILGLYHTIRDENNNHIDEEDVARWTSQNAPVPVFAFWDFAVGHDKAIGGLVISGEPQGKEAARLAKRILAGENPQTIAPITAEHGRFIFSRSGLKKWNLTLPIYFDNPYEQLQFVE